MSISMSSVQRTWLIQGLALLAALLFVAGVILLVGASPLQVAVSMWRGAFGTEAQTGSDRAGSGYLGSPHPLLLWLGVDLHRGPLQLGYRRPNNRRGNRGHLLVAA
ncbi:MAG: hypothetical protein Q6M54_14335 [Thermostichus sp. DRC_bins_24]